jgi:hypothetical protein
MPWVYSLVTVIIEIYFYWVRSNYLILFGFSELFVAFGLMYITYFPHGGPVPMTAVFRELTFWDTVTSGAEPFFVIVYAFVRGWDNVITGLRKPDI